jgi:hypothetical protein
MSYTVSTLLLRNQIAAVYLFFDGPPDPTAPKGPSA